MWSFIFVLLLGILLFNTILISEQEDKYIQSFSISDAIAELENNRSMEDNITIDSNLTSESNHSIAIGLSLILAEEDNITVLETLPSKMISLAKSKIGTSYVYGSTGPDSFDCSGFVYYLFDEHNITVPRSSLAQSKDGTALAREDLQKGDIVFFDTSGKGKVNHSGIYLGDDTFIHASSGKAKGVTISNLNAWYKDKFLWGIHK
ncbi:MAG: C40 family peptidase [Sulfurovum sp.]|nr:C40 family peptidase [Sulfurovum sp.]